MIKKILAVVLSVLCVFSLAACGAQKAADARLRIVCTAFPQYDFLREITAGVDGIDLKLLLKPGQETHDYDPSSQDILAIHDCDLFVYGGGESDHWIDSVLATVNTENMAVIPLMPLVQALPEEAGEGMTVSTEENEEAYDEHVWTSPKNAIVICNALRDVLCQTDAAFATQYTQNTAAYAEKLNALDAAFAETVQNGKRKVIVVADRFPLLYFCKAYGLQYYAAFAGCAASVEPSSATVQFLREKVKAEQIPVIFQMELSAGQVAQTVAAETACKIATFYACHNLSREDFENGETYLSLMQKNVAALQEALG